MLKIQTQVSREATNHIIEISKLPTLPSVAIEAFRLLEGEQSSFDSIADLIKNDQVLAGKILHYANTASVGTRQKVTSIPQAVAVLGFTTLRTIILSVSVFNCFTGIFTHHKKNLVNFWLHSIGVAAAAEALANKLGFPSADEAYIAGLIHDLGKLVCYVEEPAKFEQVCQELDMQGTYSTSPGLLPLDIEQNIFNTSHIEAGQRLAAQWELPATLARVMWLHHQPVFKTITPTTTNLPQLIRFADVLCVTHNVGASYFLTSGLYCHEHFHFALEHLILHHHLSADDIDEIMTEVHARVKAVSNVLGIWDEKVYHKLITAANATLGTFSMQMEKSNRRLLSSNQLLEAICDLSRKLKPNLALPEAAQAAAFAALQAFDVNRALCLIRDQESHMFVGSFYNGKDWQTVNIPADISAIKKYSRNQASSDIELEAAKQLAQTSINISQGRRLESEIINMVANSRFLATFFVADSKHYHDEEPILGELIVDFADSASQKIGLKETKKHFETFALAAGSAIENILLQKNLSRHTRQMEETSRKMEEHQHQLFHSHRLATVGRLAAGAAHEINNPLTIISLNIQIIQRLLDKKEENSELRKRLQIVSEQEERISKIIQDLMGFSRPTQPKFMQSSISQIMDKVLLIIGDRVSMAKIKVQNNIAPDLPHVLVDPLQIEQVFLNLLINANHAMPGNGEIILAAQRLNGSIKVDITDTGDGISRKNLGKIFDPFFTTKKEGEGTGLGLAVCHSIVEHNGGSLRVTSEVGKGSTFTVILPIDKSSQLRQMKKQLQKEKPAPMLSQGKHRILVIDDERILNEILQESLKQAGYEVNGAYDGVEGIELLRLKKYHLVLLDIRMPRKDGLEVLKFLKEAFPEVKVVIITGLASTEEVKETVRHGAFACIKKPFRLTKVMETLTQALKKT